MKTTVLGISFSSRMLGLAVIESNSLIDYSVKLFKETWSPTKMDRILTSLTSAMERYNITDIVLSIPPINYQGGPFQELWMEIAALGHLKNVNVKMYRLADLGILCSSPKRMSRKSLMEAITSIYPELMPYYEREMGNKNKYYHKMFEAVAAGTLYLEERKTE